jgi:2-isopropylmalate synthase
MRSDSTVEGADTISVTLTDKGQEITVQGIGNGPIAAFVSALSTLDVDVRVLDYAEHALSSGGDATAASYVECALGERVLWGVGLDANIVIASLKAVISAVNRSERDGVPAQD